MVGAGFARGDVGCLVGALGAVACGGCVGAAPSARPKHQRTGPSPILRAPAPAPTGRNAPIPRDAMHQSDGPIWSRTPFQPASVTPRPYLGFRLTQEHVKCMSVRVELNMLKLKLISTSIYYSPRCQEVFAGYILKIQLMQRQHNVLKMKSMQRSKPKRKHL